MPVISSAAFNSINANALSQTRWMPPGMRPTEDRNGTMMTAITAERTTQNINNEKNKISIQSNHEQTLCRGKG